MGYVRGDGDTALPDGPKVEKNNEQNQYVARGVRGYGVAGGGVAANEITHKFINSGGTALGYAMYVERQKAWFGRVGKEMSFGPTSLSRSRQAVEAFLGGQVFEKREGERSWRGDCMHLI